DLPIPQIKCSYRPSIVQACLYLIGRVTHGRPVTYAGPGKSKHNRLPSKAIDIKFTSVSSKKEREELFFKFAELMCKRGAKWGGHWKHLRDLSHFELAD
ncbi:MAG: M15 family metallopeptidase, partial [Bdellovibrionales bacterium]|nr:M15 family metallopeptidase [Bdellovibrionales bacterium]